MAMFDWLPSANSLTPDFGDPKSMAIFGALGNMLLAGGTPMKGTGMGAGNAAAMLLGSGLQGASSGANAAQGFQKSNIENQMGQLGLEQSKAMQPFIMNQFKNMAEGSMPGAAGGVSGGISGGSSGGSVAGITTTPADRLYMQAYSSALMSRDFGKVAQVLQSWAEHNPQLAGAIKAEQERVTPQKMPNGTYSLGGNAFSGGGFGSLVPSVTAPTGLPSSQQPTPLQPASGADLSAPPVGDNPVPPTPDAIPNNPFAPPGIKIDAPAPSEFPNTEAGVAAEKETRLLPVKKMEGIYAGDTKFLNETLLPLKESAQQGLGQTETISNSLNQMANNAWTKPGQFAEARIEAAKTVNDLVQTLGGEPLSQKELAGADAMNKSSARLASAMTKELGSREAAQIFNRMEAANPNWALSPQSNKLVTALISASFKRNIDRYNAGFQAAKSGGLAQDAVNVFDSSHPEHEYVTNAFKEAGMDPAWVNKPEPPMGAVQLLKGNAQNPAFQHQFDAKYGAGRSEFYLRGQP